MASAMKDLCAFVLSFAIFQVIFQEGGTTEFEYEYVTCGSSLKILNTYNNIRLHSHDVKYGSGSGQQSVTGVDSSDDHNSYWQVRGKTGTTCTRGNPVKCGQTVRLMHVSTRRNLHSHHFQSPLSHNLEVSAFGEDGEGDEGDNWVVVCSDKLWSRDEKVRLKHVVTEHFLHVTGNSYGRPIHGQREISGYPSANDLNYWQAAEGIFVTPSQNKDTKGSIEHDEF
ncbi:stromal cell-derived factor 2-like isoform X3 [Littorina saxatilis]|uniref:MIR domain-containing protein n=1 Tax=Littorina saxatilis TaxID=31220 RepID=A0AAN9AQZ0_9CAEN